MVRTTSCSSIAAGVGAWLLAANVHAAPARDSRTQADPKADADQLREELDALRRDVDTMREEQARRDQQAQQREEQAEAARAKAAQEAEAERAAKAKAEAQKREELEQEIARLTEAQKAQTEAQQTRWKHADRFHFSGDFRFRLEHDWDSSNDDGSERRDRFRMRYRARVGLKFDATKTLSFGVRARTGVPTNMQSPHVNVGYNGFGMAPLNLDRAYAKGDYGYLWWWAGKNSFPGFRQDEMFWDDDVTPEGVAIGGDAKLNDAISLRPSLAYFVPDHEQVLEYPDSRMVWAQLWAPIRAGKHVDLDLAVAYAYMHRIFVTPQHLGRDLWDQGGPVGPRIDYGLLYSQARATFKTRVKDYALPIVVGADHVINLEDYADVEAVADHYKDEKSMYVGYLRLGHAPSIGRSSKLGDWYLGYTFTWKERQSVVSYFTEDDWVRWGNIHGNRNTNYAGHEVRGAVAFGPHVNLLMRFYSVEAIVRRLENDAVAKETGKRVRLDLNVNF